MLNGDQYEWPGRSAGRSGKLESPLQHKQLVVYPQNMLSLLTRGFPTGDSNKRPGPASTSPISIVKVYSYLPHEP